MHLRRLSGRKVCERVKLRGLLWKGKHIQARILACPPPLPHPPMGAIFVGTLTSAKLDPSAVRRNRMRRRCREALRLSLASIERIDGAWQLLLLPRSSSLTVSFPALLSDAADLLHFLASSRASRPRPFQEIRP